MLVGGALDVGGDAPVVDEVACRPGAGRRWRRPRIEVVEADHGLGVADVDGERARRRRYESGPRVEPDSVSGCRGRCRATGADWVIWLDATAGRRRWRRRRRPSRRVMPPLHSSSGRRPPCWPAQSSASVDGAPSPPRASCCRAARRRRRPRAPAVTCVEVGRLDVDEPAGPAWPWPARPPRRCRAPPRWLSLNITQSDRLPRWFTAAAGPHRRLLAARAARAWSCGCPRCGRRRRRRPRRRSAG